jgi:hypothetical protein
MSSPILPIILTGPAIIQWNGKSYYSKAGIKSEFKRETFKVVTDFDGQIDERAKTQLTELTFQPDGQISNLNKYFPYAVTQIGGSVFGTTPLPLVIQTKFGGASNTGQTITFPRAALTKQPQLNLKPTATLFGELTFTCLGVPTVQPTGATAWQTIVDAAFSDATYDETAIVTDTYAAAYGSSPYNAMGSLAGFEINLALETEKIVADDFGIADIILKSLTASAKFAPSNLTEAQLYTLLANQGTAYVYPGQSLSKSNTNLVITGSGNSGKTLTVTINNAGPRQAGLVYAMGKPRFDSLEFTSKRTWTSGAANPLFTLTFA